MLWELNKDKVYPVNLGVASPDLRQALAPLDSAVLGFSADLARRTANPENACLDKRTIRRKEKRSCTFAFWGKYNELLKLSQEKAQLAVRTVERAEFLSPARPLTIGGLSSSSSSSGAALSFLSILLTEVVRFRWISVSKSSSNRTWSTKSGCTGLGSAEGFGVP